MLLSLWASQPRQPTGNTEPRIHPRCTLPGLLGLLGPPSLCGLQHLSVEGDPFPWRFVCPVKKSSLHSGPSLGTSPSLSGQYPGTASSSVRFHVSLNLFYSTSLSVFVRLLLSSFKHLRTDSPSLTSAKSSPSSRSASKTLAYHCKNQLPRNSSTKPSIVSCAFFLFFPRVDPSKAVFHVYLIKSIFEPVSNPQRIYYTVTYWGLWGYISAFSKIRRLNRP